MIRIELSLCHWVNRKVPLDASAVPVVVLYVMLQFAHCFAIIAFSPIVGTICRTAVTCASKLWGYGEEPSANQQRSDQNWNARSIATEITIIVVIVIVKYQGTSCRRLFEKEWSTCTNFLQQLYAITRLWRSHIAKSDCSIKERDEDNKQENSILIHCQRRSSLV